jgi:hypothetical protein
MERIGGRRELLICFFVDRGRGRGRRQRTVFPPPANCALVRARRNGNKRCGPSGAVVPYSNCRRPAGGLALPSAKCVAVEASFPLRRLRVPGTSKMAACMPTKNARVQCSQMARRDLNWAHVSVLQGRKKLLSSF